MLVAIYTASGTPPGDLGGADGRIDVAWLDYRKDHTFTPGPQAQNAFQDVYMASSSDGGETWSANMRVTDRSIDRRLSDVWTTGVHSAVGLHALDSGSYVAWDDTRNATGEFKAQTSTSPVCVSALDRRWASPHPRQARERRSHGAWRGQHWRWRSPVSRCS